jgi:hypothetical protein
VKSTAQWDSSYSGRVIVHHIRVSFAPFFVQVNGVRGNSNAFDLSSGDQTKWFADDRANLTSTDIAPVTGRPDSGQKAEIGDEVGPLEP